VFHLAQLSFTECVFTVAGVVEPNGDPERDRYAYEVARVHSRHTDHSDRALPVFDALSRSCSDPVLALASAAQGVGHSIRDISDVARADEFAARGVRIIDVGLPDDWHSDLVCSRFHRAVALLRVAQRDASGMQAELSEAMRFGDAVFATGLAGTDQLVARENRRILVESKIKSVSMRRGDETDAEVAALSAELAAIDPYCVEARIIAGDGYAAAGDYAEAAEQYRQAGQLGTVSGAMAWFRAGQCHDFLGDRAAAVNAMGRCLELDASAIDPREYIREHSRTGVVQPTPIAAEAGIA
jgi:tetratricopeptide (TPR) repeat protein